MKLAVIWQNKILRPILALLKQGVSSEKIALSLACGITLGVFPVIGATILLCAAAAAMFKLNQTAIQLINFLVYPLQIFLLIPFYRAGDYIFNAQPLPFSTLQVVAMLNQDLWGAVSLLWNPTLRAIAVWLILAPLATMILYRVLIPTIRKLPFKFGSQGEGERTR